jgi:hypothetical protein
VTRRRGTAYDGERFEEAFKRLIFESSLDADGGGLGALRLAKERAFGRWGQAPDEDLTITESLRQPLSAIAARRSPHPVGLRWRLERLHGYSCLYCGTRADLLVLDHIVAFVRGGRHDEGNLAPACQPCNSNKTDLTLPRWLARRPDLSEVDIRRRWLEARGDIPLPGLDP